MKMKLKPVDFCKIINIFMKDNNLKFNTVYTIDWTENNKDGTAEQYKIYLMIRSDYRMYYKNDINDSFEFFENGSIRSLFILTRNSGSIEISNDLNLTVGDKYYTIELENNCDIIKTEWTNSDLDRYRKFNGNVFKTKKSAISYKQDILKIND